MTLEQVPAYLLVLGEKLSNIEQFLTSTPEHSPVVERPFDIEEAVRFTGLERPTIYASAQRGEIPAHKRGKKWYFYATELNEWIKNGGKKTLENNAEVSLMAANKRRLHRR